MFELNKENVKKIILIVAVGIVLYWGLQNLSLIGNVLALIFKLIFPFILGLAIAFILNVIVNFLENKVLVSKKNGEWKSKFKRPISVIISILLLIAIIIFILFLVVPELINTFSIFAQKIPTVANEVKEWLINLTANYPNISEKIQSINFDWEKINDSIIKYAQSGVSTAVSASINFVMATISGIVNFIIGFVFAIYILLQKEKLTKQVKKLIYAYLPAKRAKQLLHTATLTNNTFSNFLTGQLTDAFLLGVLCFIGMLILKIPYALTISVLIGFTALIPIVGALLGAFVGAILIVVSSPVKALVFIVFLIILQQIEGNIIYPKVVGDSVGLSGMWVLIAITIGGNAMGLIGMIISVPIASIVYAIMSERIKIRLRHRKIKVE